MIKFNFELSSKPNKKGLYVVRLRMTEDRKHSRQVTPVEIRKTDWSQKSQKVKTSAEHADELNELLFKIKNDAIKKYSEMKEAEAVSPSSLQRQLKSNAEKHGVIDFFKSQVNHLMLSKSIGTAKKMADMVNKLEAYLLSEKKSDLLINEFGLMEFEGFKSYLYSIKNSRDKSKGLSSNTITKHLKILHGLLTEAVKADLIKTNPLSGLKLKETSTIQRHLSYAEFEKLKTAKLVVGTVMDKARDMFVAAYYLGGMRLFDILLLRWRNLQLTPGDERLQYVMSKNKKKVYLKVYQDVMPILRKYLLPDRTPDDFVFPFLSAENFPVSWEIDTMPLEEYQKLYSAVNSKETLVNRELKNCADYIGISEFSFHSSRRMFVNTANEAGVRSCEIQQLMCHSSLSTTEKYLKEIDTTELDNAIDITFSGDSREKQARVYVNNLIRLGYGKRDVKKLFDEAMTPTFHRKNSSGNKE